MNVYRIPRHRLVPVGAAVTLVMAGCGGSKAYVRPGFMEHPPKRVANHLTRSLVENLSRSPAVMAYLSERN